MAEEAGGSATAARHEHAASIAVRGALAAVVLPPMIAWLAARADLSVDRLNDAVLVGDALALHAQGSEDDRVRIDFSLAPGLVRFEVASTGGLPQGASPDGPLGSILRRLADDVRTDGVDGTSMLVVHIGVLRD